MRVFPDTNVWLSAIVFSGLCSELLARLLESDHVPLTSALIKAEADEVLHRKFSCHTRALSNFDWLWQQVECCDDVHAPADDADARLIHAARKASTDVFITGDRRVLGWDNHSGMRILSPRDAWTLLFAAAAK